MKNPRLLLLAGLMLGLSACNSRPEASAESAVPVAQAANTEAAAASSQTLYDFTMLTIDGMEQKLDAYKGKVVVVVNVASKCGLTPQYESIEKFYRQYKGKGVVVLGFPANNFMGQEPGSNEEIKDFCKAKYDVSFPMFAKISVKGEDMHPLYRYLTTATGEEVKWNFQKFIVGKDGKVIRAFSPRTTVDEQEFLDAVNAAL